MLNHIRPRVCESRKLSYVSYLFPSWQGSHTPAYGYTFAVVLLGLYIFHILNDSNIFKKIFAVVGQNSYHIYLCQILYMTLVYHIIQNNYFIKSGEKGVMQLILVVLTNIILCVIFGIILNIRIGNYKIFGTKLQRY